MNDWVWDGMGLMGLVLLVAALSMVSVPLGMGTFGVVLLGIAIVGARRKPPGKDKHET